MTTEQVNTATSFGRHRIELFLKETSVPVTTSVDSAGNSGQEKMALLTRRGESKSPFDDVAEPCSAVYEGQVPGYEHDAMSLRAGVSDWLNRRIDGFTVYHVGGIITEISKVHDDLDPLPKSGAVTLHEPKERRVSGEHPATSSDCEQATIAFTETPDGQRSPTESVARIPVTVAVDVGDVPVDCVCCCSNGHVRQTPRYSFKVLKMEVCASVSGCLPGEHPP
jgi:hypothetical protein